MKACVPGCASLQPCTSETLGIFGLLRGSCLQSKAEEPGRGGGKWKQMKGGAHSIQLSSLPQKQEEGSQEKVVDGKEREG